MPHLRQLRAPLYIAVLCSLTAPLVGAAEPALAAPLEVRIATVDTARVLDENPVSKAALAGLLERKDTLKRALEKRRQKAGQLVAEIRSLSAGESSAPAPVDAAALNAELSALRRDSAEFERETKELIGADYRKIRERFLEQVRSAARAVAREHRCVMAVDCSAVGPGGIPLVLGVVDGIDITDEVLAKLDLEPTPAVATTSKTQR